jgi:cell fate regulator YaaT (PSP1 superfamily)
MKPQDITTYRGCSNLEETKPCNSSSQNRMDVFDWLSDIPLPDNYRYIIEVRFKNTRKDYFYNVNHLQLKQGDVVAVEAQKGHDIGIVSLTGHLVLLNMRKKHIDTHAYNLKKIYRLATPNDIDKWKEAIAAEKMILIKTRKIIQELNLAMKLADVEFQGDKTKVTFFYIADNRVDFRELIKILADRFKVRVEMRQIGARQEAGLVGGIGPCGRELCCSKYMYDFKSVNTNTARIQELSLNMQKLTGLCGKLKCCLNFEAPVYEDARKEMPNTKQPLKTKDGEAYYVNANIFKKELWYSYQKTLVPLSFEAVETILDLNAKGELIDDLYMFVEKKEDDELNFISALEQDSLKKVNDSIKRKNKSKKRRNKRRKSNNHKKNSNNVS